MNRAAASPIPGKRARLQHWVHQRLRANGRSLEITKSGWLLIGLTLLVGAVAINSGANLLHLVFGALVGMILLSGIASERMLSRAKVSRRMAGICFEGQPAPVEIQLENTHSRRPLLCVSVETHFPDQTQKPGPVLQAPCLSLHVAPGQTQTLSSTITASKRGLHPAPPLVLATRYPWGFFLKRKEIACPMNLHVAPTPGRAEKAVYASRAPAAGKVAHKAARIGELGEHRVYRPGDDPRRIDYKRSAKSQELLLRESLDQSLDSARFALPDASDPRLEQKLQDICAASVQRQSQGLAFSYLRGDEPVYSAQQSLRSPRQAFQILATHASQAA